MSNQKNKPAAQIRDGAIKASIWRNFGEKGTFYSVEITRTYTDAEGKYHDSHGFSGTELLQVSVIAQQAYSLVAELRQQDAQDREQRAA